MRQRGHFVHGIDDGIWLLDADISIGVDPLHPTDRRERLQVILIVLPRELLLLSRNVQIVKCHVAPRENKQRDRTQVTGRRVRVPPSQVLGRPLSFVFLCSRQRSAWPRPEAEALNTGRQPIKRRREGRDRGRGAAGGPCRSPAGRARRPR